MKTSPGLYDTALDAFYYCFPLFEMARMRAATSLRRNPAGEFAGASPESTLRWVNLFTHTRALLDPSSWQVVTPNNDTLYTNAWLNLSLGPLLLHVPDTADRYYVLGLLDFYTNPFAHLGRRTSGTAERMFLLHGPGWQGDAPAATTAIACPTDSVWILGRILVDGADDVPAVNRLQDQFWMQRLEGSQHAGNVAGSRVDVWMGPKEQASDPWRFIDIANRALAQNPPPASEDPLMRAFGPLGIGPYRRADAAALEADTRAAVESAFRDGLAELGRGIAGVATNGWRLPVTVTEHYGTDYRTRALVARHYIGVLGADEALYLIAEVDGDGRPLSGRHRYRLAFRPGGLPPVDEFWSITLYRKSSCLLVENPLARYSIGDRTQGLVYDAGGALEILFGHDPPEAQQLANWLPAPEDEFYLVLRAYQPRPAFHDGSYAVPPIERVNRA